MKVAHHGSKTSTSAEWLAYWRPEAVLISVGASNTYGHPHPVVMERLEAQGPAFSAPIGWAECS